MALLRRAGLKRGQAARLTEDWLIQGDFLLTDLDHPFDIVIGNPPYVRQELIPAPLIAEYRARYRTVFDRADMYIPFIEHALEALREGGALGFICADRWTKNRYGGPLRRMVSENYRLKIYVDMVGTPAFRSDVIAYPAITVITREGQGPTRIAHQPVIDKTALCKLAGELLSNSAPDPNGQIRQMTGVVQDDQPWILGSFDQLELVRRLERDFPTIEDAGCKVGIGVATGADKAFIGPFAELDVEDDRKLPLAMTRDIQSVGSNGAGLASSIRLPTKGGSWISRPIRVCVSISKRVRIRLQNATSRKRPRAIGTGPLIASTPPSRRRRNCSYRHQGRGAYRV